MNKYIEKNLCVKLDNYQEYFFLCSALRPPRKVLILQTSERNRHLRACQRLHFHTVGLYWVPGHARVRGNGWVVTHVLNDCSAFIYKVKLEHEGSIIHSQHQLRHMLTHKIVVSYCSCVLASWMNNLVKMQGINSVKIRPVWSFEMLGTTHPTTQCHIPEDLKPWKHSWGIQFHIRHYHSYHTSIMLQSHAVL